MAQAYLRPTVQAAFTVRVYNESKEREGPALMALIAELGNQTKAVNGGDLGRAEATLICQAHVLDTIFGTLVRRATTQDYLKQYETYMRLGLKAQSQCRATLETLALIRNPPVLFAKQANVTTGPQQINNGTAPPSRAREFESEQTQLSGVGNVLPDTRTSAIAGRIDPQMEAVGEIDRAEVRRG